MNLTELAITGTALPIPEHSTLELPEEGDFISTLLAETDLNPIINQDYSGMELVEIGWVAGEHNNTESKLVKKINWNKSAEVMDAEAVLDRELAQVTLGTASNASSSPAADIWLVSKVDLPAVQDVELNSDGTTRPLTEIAGIDTEGEAQATPKEARMPVEPMAAHVSNGSTRKDDTLNLGTRQKGAKPAAIVADVSYQSRGQHKSFEIPATSTIGERVFSPSVVLHGTIVESFATDDHPQQEAPKLEIRSSGKPSKEPTTQVAIPAKSVSEDGLGFLPKPHFSSENHLSSQGQQNVNPVGIVAAEANLAQFEVTKLVGIESKQIADLGVRMVEPDFDASLENKFVRDLERTAFVGKAMPIGVSNQIQQSAIAQQVLYHVRAELSSNKAMEFEIRLDPEELGKLRVNVALRDTGLVISLVAERQETVELLRRHASDLLEGLADTEFEGASLDFSQGKAFQRDEIDEATQSETADESPTQLMSTSLAVRHIGTDRLDIRL